MEKHKTCSFFGHRKIEIDDALKQQLTTCVENLILSHNVQTFLFGSKSNFNDLCHSVVSQLKQKYPYLKRVRYTCKNETCTLEIDREKQEQVFSALLKKQVHLLGFEEEFEHKTKYQAGKASYVERNQAIINDSDYCVFYYDENYLPPINTTSRFPLTTLAKSGTMLAYKYATRKKKQIINLKQKDKA